MDENTEMQRRKMTCSRSYKCLVGYQGQQSSIQATSSIFFPLCILPVILNHFGVVQPTQWE